MGHQGKGPVQDQDGIADHRRPQEHGPEALLGREGGIALPGDLGHPQAAEEPLGQRLGRMP